MKRFPEKDWRGLLRQLISAPASGRQQVLKEAARNMAREDYIMILVEMQLIFRNISPETGLE
jgi:hypothetical protein